MKNLIFFICFCQFIFGQEIVLEFKNELQLNSSKIKESYTILDKENNDLTVLLSDLKKLYVYQFDSILNKKNKILTEDLPKKYKKLLGYQIFGNEYTIFFSNIKKNKIGYKRINFKKQSSISAMMDYLDLKRERFLQTISHKNKFYLLTVGWNTSRLFFYEFDKNINYKKHEVDLSSLNDVSYDGERLKAFDVLAINPYAMSTPLGLKKIDESNPNSIESTSKDCKLYVKENEFVLTFDHKLGYTKVFIVNDETFEVEEKEYEINDGNEYKKSNSFIGLKNS